MEYIRRNDQAIIGDIAENDIKALCARLGWAVEKVQNDYGDDLLVQTRENERVDPFKVWIQVKGTTDLSRKKNMDGSYSQSLSKGNVWKWIRSRDICIVVLWDINRQEGVCSVVKDDVDFFDIYKTDSESMTLRIDGQQSLTLASMVRVCWQARLEYYESTISLARVECEINGSGDDSHNPLSRKFLLVVEYLHSVGVLAHFGEEKNILLTETCQKYFSEGLIKWRAQYPNDSEYNSRGAVVSMMIVLRVEEVTGCNISQSLLMDCLEFFEHFGRKFDRFDGSGVY